jgi:dolichyl-phosphooligosaccharide-protein glycotransferase
MSKHEKKKDNHQEKEESEDISFNVSKVKNFIKRKRTKKTHHENKSDEVDIGLKSIWNFFYKYRTIFLIIIPIVLCIFLRAQPFYLPITDNWGEQTVHGYYQNQIESQINQQYPNLPPANKAALVDEQFQQLLVDNGDNIQKQIEETSESFKSRLQDDDGQTYLLAIDPYLWYSYAKNYIDHGDFGNGVNEETGETWDYKRNGRIGQKRTFQFSSAVEVLVGKIVWLFSDNVSLLTIAFLIPLLMVTLAVIPVYFMTRRIVGDFGALIASSLFAVHSALMTRTVAGFSDTDPYNALFPVLIIWLIVETFMVKSRILKLICAFFAAVSTMLFSIAWSGWWHIFGFILGSFGIYFIRILVDEIIHGSFSSLKDRFISKNLVHKVYEPVAYYFGFIIVISTITSFIFGLSQNFLGLVKHTLLSGPLSFLTMKNVAISTIWPNVLTTVAELNPSSWSQAVGSMGSIFLFLIAIAGTIFCFVKTHHSRDNFFFGVLMILWLGGTTFAASSSLRFSALMVPAFSVCLGLGVGFIVSQVPKLIKKSLDVNAKISKIVLIVVFILILIQPIRAGYNVAINEVPSFNDDWYNSLERIQEGSDDAIISSWWDFGHWFVAMGERRVTFDGGNQGNRIHWIGRSLQTSSEKESVDIIKMLNCGQEESYKKLENYTSETEVKDSYLAITTLKSIIGKEQSVAKDELLNIGLTNKQAEDVLQYSHCDNLIDNYMIASEDMVGKAGVWGHFGSWDFTRGAMYQAVKGQKKADGVDILITKFGLDEDEATDIYFGVQNNDADRWVSGWPGYISSPRGCSKKDNSLECTNSVQGNAISVNVNLQSMTAIINTNNGQKVVPDSLVYADASGLHEKKLEGEAKTGFSLALIPRTDGGYNSMFVSPELAASMFTSMFFYNGHGLRCYDSFGHDVDVTGLDIYTYKLDWDCEDMTIMPAIQAQIDANIEVRASHILVNTSEEAEAVIEQLNSGADFAELAKEKSVGPTGPNGGDLGFFTRGRMVPEFENAVFSLEVIGDHTPEPVKSQFGYHIIKLTDKKDNNQYSLNNAKESTNLE